MNSFQDNVKLKMPAEIRPGTVEESWFGGTAANRITAAVSGITGTTLGAGGGDQRLHAHNHGVTDPGHVHTETNTSFPAGANLMGGSGVTSQTNTVNTGTATTGISIQNNTQGGTAQNVQPSLIVNYIIKI